MNIALVFGDKGEALKPKLLGIRDNLSIDCYNTVEDLVKNAFKRNIIYDRILCTSSVFRTNTVLDDLYNFWSATYSKSEIITVCRAGADDLIAEKLITRFSAPNVGAMLTNGTTMQTIAEAILEPVSSLENKYNTVRFRKEVSVDTGIVIESPSLPVETKEEPKQEEVKHPVDKNNGEKRSLLGALFGGKKQKNKPNKPSEPNSTETSDSAVETQEQSSLTEEVKQTEVKNEVKVETEPVSENSVETTESYEEVESTSTVNEATVETLVDVDTEPMYASYYEDNSDNSDEVKDSSEDETKNLQLVSEEPSLNVEEQFTSVFTDIHKEPTQETFEAQSNVTDTRQTLNESNGLNPTETVSDNMDIDFSNIDMSSIEPKKKPNQRTVQVATTVTDDAFSAVDLSNAEAEYRRMKEQPKVIVKTEVKEVIRGGNTNLQRINSGAGHKVIVCTGDRGSGVTTTALTLANYFAKNVPVLYVDCDIQKHGLLNYIDYDEFSSQDDVRKKGTKLCKSTRAFAQCICPMDDNFDVLSADFSCDTTEEELEDTSATVTAMMQQYGVVIVDCPAENLTPIKDLIFSGVTVLNVEASRRGFMNILCVLENSPLPPRYKRMLVDRCTMLVSKVPNKFNIDKLKDAISQVYEPDEINWLAPKPIPFNGKLDDALVESILSKF